jgi:hypothetical protein
MWPIAQHEGIEEISIILLDTGDNKDERNRYP